MLRSPAYRSLDCYARCLLIELNRLYRPGKNGSLFLSTRMAAELLNASPQTAMRAFHALADRGFIKARQRGDFNWKARHATTWVLTEFEHAGSIPTKEFTRWQRTTEKQNTVPRGEQTVPPGEQAVSPQEQTTPETTPSVSRQEQIRPKTPSICSPRGTQVVTRAGGRGGTQPSSASAAPRSHSTDDDGTLKTIDDATANIINLNKPRAKRRAAS